MKFENSLSYAEDLDSKDPLSHFRQEFIIPQHDGEPIRYFTGNSLGLQPRAVQSFINDELESWGDLAVDGHFKGKRPWFHYHKFSKESLARLVGAKPSEVVAMNNLSVNLHLLMVSFYRPNANRYKIIIEKGAFPSDQYIVETQLQFHGFDPEIGLIELTPAEGEETLSTSDILSTINAHGNETALVLLSGVQYYTGQFFEIEPIASCCSRLGICLGLDLAHAAGNVPLLLHDHQVDFAAWCSYKYLNSGPGNTSAIFVHEKHSQSNLPRFGGWWGHDEALRFHMRKGFMPMAGADGWQLSNVNVLGTAALLASLTLFDQAGMEALRAKSMQLTGFLEFLLQDLPVRIITPKDPKQRGCQLSLTLNDGGKEVFQRLGEKGFVLDWREPNVMRIAPVPLYNTFREVYEFKLALEAGL